MKKLIAIVLAVTLMASVMGVAGVALAGKDLNGNGAPNGAHYNLNIIGMQNDNGKNCEGGGHVIFVKLGKNGMVRTRIDLKPGADFYVEDCNGLDGKAKFYLPADVSANWEVYVRALGKPSGSADMRTCGEIWDEVGEVWIKTCGPDLVLEAHGNNNKFSNESSKLLTVDGVPLFDITYENYFWEYDNKGLKLAQLRFYPAAS